MKINNIKLMNKQIKAIFVLAFTLVMSVTSCLNEVSDPNGGGNALPGNVESLDSQVAAMKISVGDLESVSGALVGVAETLDVDALKAELESCSASVQDHIASVESGAQAVASTLKALELQAEIAQTVGALKAQVEMLEANGMTRVLTERIQTLEEGVASWLGDKFKNYYLVSSEQVRANELGSIAEDQSISVDALQSDVEAGLRVGDATEELATMAKTVGNNSQALAKLSNEFGVLSSEVKEVYSDAIKSSDSDTKSTLKSVNTKAAAALKSSTSALDDLSARITALETRLDDVERRLTKLETDVEGLLSKIQSITFMSEYSEDYAIAYYEMDNAKKIVAPEKPYNGKSMRTPVHTVELNYMVRPASAASAVPSANVSVVGYYANQIQTHAIDPTKFINFRVTSIAVTNADRGIVTIMVENKLNDDFYYRQTGAKCAMSIATGNTDISSKFVELYPRDNVTTVYVEDLTINHDDFEIDEGQSKTLTATLNPSSATNKTLKWTSSDPSVVSIDQASGIMKAEKQGNATITVTTNGIDEWGDNLSASVNVKVNPAVRLGGPLYVEVGKTTELSLDFPPAMNIESKIWSSSDETKATVENGFVEGVVHTYNQYTYQYNPITITCVVNGVITLTHEMYVVVPQPRQIRLNNYADDVKSISMKLDQTISLAGSILPENVDASLFRITYESDGGLGWINFDSGEIKTPGSVGGRYVYIKVKDIDKNTYMKTSVERTMIVNVEPYYIASIDFDDVQMQPGASVTLNPSFTSDVSGKQPTNIQLVWESSDTNIATVDENGLVEAIAVGDVTITATATDGSGVTGMCNVTITEPWKDFEVGDFVIYKDGEIEFSKSASGHGGTIVGIVIAKVNPRVSDVKLPESCTHGIAVGLNRSKEIYWWKTYYNQQPQSLSKYVEMYPDEGYVNPAGVSYASAYVINDVGKRPTGYTNTLLLKRYRERYSLSMNDDLIDEVDSYSTTLPNGTSGWYIPSIYEMNMIYQAYKNNSLDTSLWQAGGTQLDSKHHWTVSEVEGTASSNAAAMHPKTGEIISKIKTAYGDRPYVRFVFAF